MTTTVARPSSALHRRPYADADLPLLQRTVAGWIAAAGRCGYDHIGELPHRIYENLRGRRPVGDLVHVWADDAGTTAGLTIALRFGEAFDVFTAPDWRGTDGDRALIDGAAATTAAGTEPGAPYVLTDVFDCDTVRIRLLEELGFTRFRVWDDVQERELDGGDALPPVVLPDGFTVRAARPGDAAELAAARNSAFDDDWTGERYRAAVMDKPGYDPGRELVAESPGGRIAAFTVVWFDEHNSAGHFEPVGTHNDFRRLGLARAVMALGLRLMRERGLSTVSVNHNAENLAAAGLYRSLGFAARHQTFGYRRQIR